MQFGGNSGNTIFRRMSNKEALECGNICLHIYFKPKMIIYVFIFNKKYLFTYLLKIKNIYSHFHFQPIFIYFKQKYLFTF